MADIFLVMSAQSYPVLSTEQHNEVPEQAGRIPVQEVVVTRTLQRFVLGELYHIHLMGLLPNGHKMRDGLVVTSQTSAAYTDIETLECLYGYIHNMFLYIHT